MESSHLEKTTCEYLFSHPVREVYIRHFMETVLEGITGEPKLCRQCLRVISSFQWQFIEVNLDLFERKQRARIIGVNGEVAKAIRKLLDVLCITRGWRCKLCFTQSNQSYAGDSEVPVKGPIVNRVRTENSVNQG